ncbi:MAG: MFS transporter [Treponema sp.]|nr:MFS transporter [Treponema sp.]
MKKRFFDSKILNTRVKTENITAKEKWLGYLLGPSGALLLNAILGGSFLNIFYTDVIGIGGLWKGMFLAVFPLVAKIFDAITNFIMGWIIEKTKTSQGKARPYIFVSAFILPISGILLYTIPEASQLVQAIWIMISYNLFFSFAFTIYNMSHNMMVPLSTRNSEERGGVAVFTQIAAIMVTGIIAALVVPMVLLPMMGTSKTMWINVMSVISIICFPLILLEYFYTKERVTEEATESTPKIPYAKQIKAVLTDNYTILILLYYLVYSLCGCIRTNSIIYFCNYVLGTYADGITQTLLNVIGGLPMGIGIFAVWPIAKRIGKKNITLIGLILMSLGGLICWLFPTNMVMMLIGQFIKNLGSLPSAYVFMALMADVLDHLEWKNGFRCDGFAMSIYSTFAVVLNGLSLGIINGVLNATGYVVPFTATKANLAEIYASLAEKGLTAQMAIEQLKPTMDGIYTVAVNQNAATNNSLIFLFVGLEVITCLICAFIFYFIKVEKTIAIKQKVIECRRTGEALEINSTTIPELQKSDVAELWEKESKKESLRGKNI